MNQVFADFDFENFWDNSNELSNEFVGKPLTNEMVENAEKILGYSLPNSYIELLKNQNGGATRRLWFSYKEHSLDKKLCLKNICGIDKFVRYSLFDSSLREGCIVPFSIIDNKTAIAFDYENCANNNPYIVLVTINKNDNINSIGTFNSEIPLVVNFEEFIKSLDCGE